MPTQQWKQGSGTQEREPGKTRKTGYCLTSQVITGVNCPTISFSVLSYTRRTKQLYSIFYSQCDFAILFFLFCSCLLMLMVESKTPFQLSSARQVLVGVWVRNAWKLEVIKENSLLHPTDTIGIRAQRRTIRNSSTHPFNGTIRRKFFSHCDLSQAWQCPNSAL